MRLQSRLAQWTATVLCATLAGSACPSQATAQSPSPNPTQESFRTAADPKGRFTIGLPDDWSITSMDTTAQQLVADPTAMKIPGVLTMSMLIGAAPHESGEVPASVIVATIQLDASVSPAAVMARIRESQVNSGEATAAGRILAAGSAQVAGRDAYYVYHTITNRKPQLCQLMVLVPADNALVMLLGQTANEAERVKQDMPLIRNIINTFRFTISRAPSVLKAAM